MHDQRFGVKLEWFNRYRRHNWLGLFDLAEKQERVWLKTRNRFHLILHSDLEISADQLDCELLALSQHTENCLQNETSANFFGDLWKVNRKLTFCLNHDGWGNIVWLFHHGALHSFPFSLFCQNRKHNIRLLHRRVLVFLLWLVTALWVNCHYRLV